MPKDIFVPPYGSSLKNSAGETYEDKGVVAFISIRRHRCDSSPNGVQFHIVEKSTKQGGGSSQ